MESTTGGRGAVGRSSSAGSEHWAAALTASCARPGSQAAPVHCERVLWAAALAAPPRRLLARLFR